MSKPIKNIYRILAWLLTGIVASGTLIGCRGLMTKYGAPPVEKYGPPSVSSLKNINDRS